MATKIKILFFGLVVIIACGYLIEYTVEEINKKIDWEEILTEEEQEDLNEEILVERVIDGDTIKLSDGNVVRYIGINAMEMNSKNDEVLEMAKKATKRNKELVEGKKVVLEKDVSETDRYGRLLRYVYVDNQMINETLLEEGLVQVSTYPPDVKYKELFLEIQRKASEEKVGLWGLK
jgi:micrococcal nuclease